MHDEVLTGRHSSDSLALGLGLFSVGLGLAELAAPRAVATLAGLPTHERALALLRACGAREMGTGLAILAQPERAAWMWSRIAGDAADAATLAGFWRDPRARRRRLAVIAAALGGLVLLDVLCARQLAARQAGRHPSDRRAARERRARTAVRVIEAVTINQPLEQVEERWATLEAMPESFQRLDHLRGMESRAIVEFRQAPGGRGTEVRVTAEYSPRGATARALARLFGGDPLGRIREDLRRFKQLVETGEVLVSDGPSLWRAARPAARPHSAPGSARLVGEEV
jgi:uncharacterized membrane protein